MMVGSTMCEVKIFMITIQAPDSSRELNVDVTKVEKWELQKTDNPNYQSIKVKYPHLMEFDTRDDDPKPHIPVHFILGASERAAIKMPEGPHIGCPGDPIAEKTYLVWTIMSPGKELDHIHRPRQV